MIFSRRGVEAHKSERPFRLLKPDHPNMDPAIRAFLLSLNGLVLRGESMASESTVDGEAGGHGTEHILRYMRSGVA